MIYLQKQWVKKSCFCVIINTNYARMARNTVLVERMHFHGKLGDYINMSCYPLPCQLWSMLHCASISIQKHQPSTNNVNSFRKFYIVNYLTCDLESPLNAQTILAGYWITPWIQYRPRVWYRTFGILDFFLKTEGSA